MGTLTGHNVLYPSHSSGGKSPWNNQVTLSNS